MMWNETGSAIRHHSERLLSAVRFAYTKRTPVFSGSNRYTTTIKIDHHNGERTLISSNGALKLQRLQMPTKTRRQLTIQRTREALRRPPVINIGKSKGSRSLTTLEIANN